MPLSHFILRHNFKIYYIDRMADFANKFSRDDELLQLIGKFLSNKGFNSAYEELKKESGLSLEHHSATNLRTAILEGKWEEAESCLNQLSKIVDKNLNLVLFLLLEQQFLENLEDGNILKALHILRNRLSPLNINRDRIHLLASCLMCRTSSELMIQAGTWLGKSNGSRQILMENIQKLIPANTMLPSHRLEELIYSGIESQINNCLFHNSTTAPDHFSLLVPHCCSIKDFPVHLSQKIKVNDNELWMCKFSPNGKYLAVGGKDHGLELYNVNLSNHSVSHHLTLPVDGYQSFITWSPDSKKLAVCFGEEQSTLNVCDVKTGSQICVQRVNDDDSYTAAAFFSDNRKLAFGGIKGTFYVIDTEDNGRILTIVEGYRVQAMVAVIPPRTDCMDKPFKDGYTSSEYLKDLPPGAPDSLYMSNSNSCQFQIKNFPENYNPNLDYLLVADSMHRVGLFVFGNNENGSGGTSGHSMTSLNSQNPRQTTASQSGLQPFINLSLADDSSVGVSNPSSYSILNQSTRRHISGLQTASAIGRSLRLNTQALSSLRQPFLNVASSNLTGMPLFNTGLSGISHRPSGHLASSNLILMPTTQSTSIDRAFQDNPELVTQQQMNTPQEVIRTSDDTVESGVVRLFSTYRLEFQDNIPPITTAQQYTGQSRNSSSSNEGSSLITAMNLSLLASQMTTDNTPSTAALGTVTTATVAEDDEQSHESESNSTATSLDRNQCGQQNSQYSLHYHKTLFSEQYPIQSFSLSRDGTKLLICVHKMGLHLWDLKSCAITNRFVGAKQELLRLFPVIGGYDDSFISMGSEDGKIHFWKIDNRSDPIYSMSGVNPSPTMLNDMNLVNNPKNGAFDQTGNVDCLNASGPNNNIGPSSSLAVNCVSWNPALDSMIASVNDDSELVIWTPYNKTKV